MTRVWFVSSGYYSSYRVQKVFSSRELAEEYVAGHRQSLGDDWFVEPRLDDLDGELDGFLLVEALPDVHVDRIDASAVIYADGRRADSEVTERWYPGIDEFDRTPISTYRHVHLYHDPAVSINVSGTDVARCRKTLSEMAAQATAEFDVIVEAARAERAARDAEFTARYGTGKDIGS